MNLFTAAVYSNSYMAGQNRYVKLNDVEKSIVHVLPNILESFHYIKSERVVANLHENRAQVFLDSGAFSAHTLGVTITVEEYVEWIHRHEAIVRREDGVLMASVLDAIGDPLQTYRNQLAMERLGVRPLPCFHADEDFRYCDFYANNYEYITLGGMVGAATDVLIRWLDVVWERCLVDGAGRPKTRVHGFGITSIPIMERYPWYSVDSSSWIQTASFGSIMTPEWGPISVSSKSPSRHTEGQHITTYAPIEQERILASIGARGFELERLANVYESRAAFNLMGYNEIGVQMTRCAKPTFSNEQAGLFA